MQIQAFRDRAFDAARPKARQLAIEPDEMAKGAADYARRYRNFPIHSREEMLHLFQDAGFAMDGTRFTGAGGENKGPSTNQDAEYALIVATRNT
jgi:hypothetical protein